MKTRNSFIALALLNCFFVHGQVSKVEKTINTDFSHSELRLFKGHVQSILHLPDSSEFIVQSFDKVSEEYWGRIQLKTSGERRLYFTIANTFDTLRSFVLNSQDSVIHQAITGYHIPVSKRTIPKSFAQAVVPIHLPDSGNFTLYLKLYTENKVISQWRNFEKPLIYQEIAFNRYINTAYQIGGIYLGITLLAIIISLIWYAQSNKKVHLFFLLLLLTGLAYKCATSGYLTEWLFPGQAIISAYLRNVFPDLITSFYLLFCIAFVNNIKKVNGLSTLGNWLIFLQWLLFVGFVLSGHYQLKSIVVRGIYDNLIILGIGIYTLFKLSRKPYRHQTEFYFFSGGVFVYLAGTISIFLHYFLGLFETNYFFIFLFSITTSLREILLFLGVSFGFIRNETLLLNERNRIVTLESEREVEKRQLIQELNNKLQHDLKQKTAELNREQKLKNRFFTGIAHELRTPVMLIKGPLQLLMKGQNRWSREQSLIETAQRNANRLNLLINQMLDLSKQDDEAFRLRPQWTSIAKLLQEVELHFRPVLEYENIRFRITDETDQAEAKLDPQRTEIVLFNLLSNAQKACEEGDEIAINASLEGGRLLIKISDTGPGVPPKIRDRIFDIYFSHSENDTPSSGVGLFMAKLIMERHGGSIALENQHIGAHFRISFDQTPIRESELQQKVSTGKAQPVVSRAIKILIAEDEPDTRLYLEHLLDGYSTHFVRDGQEALTYLEQQKVDLLITDLMMPYVSGSELILHMKQSPELVSIPTIILSAKAMDEEFELMYQPGITEYIRKPFQEEVLFHSMGVLLQFHQARQEVSQEPLVDLEEHDHEFMIAFHKYVRAHLDNSQINILQVARELAVSERQLFRITRKLTGMSPAALIKELRLQESKFLLENRKVEKAGQASKRVGYTSVSYFSQAFKQRFGISPSEAMGHQTIE